MLLNIEVKFTLQVPELTANNDEILEWLRYELGKTSSMKMKNPLSGHELYADGDDDVEFKYID